MIISDEVNAGWVAIEAVPSHIAIHFYYWRIVDVSAMWVSGV